MIDDDDTVGNFENIRRASARENLESQPHIYGYPMPRWIPRICPRSTQVSAFIVRYAPCFWCRNPLESSLTVRVILMRLTVMCSFIALVQVASFAFLLVVSRNERIIDRNSDIVAPKNPTSENSPNLWDINGVVYFTGALAMVLCLVLTFARHATKTVHLPSLIRVIWIMLWLSPLEVYAAISLFGTRRDVHSIDSLFAGKSLASNPCLNL